MKKINQRLVEKINEATEGRDINNRMKNILYYLISSYKYARTVNISEDDINFLADDLEFNNKVIDSDNVEEYDSEFFEKREVSKGMIKKIKSGEKLLITKYCDINQKLIACRILLDANYNVF